MSDGQVFVDSILSRIKSPFDRAQVITLLQQYAGTSVYLPVTSMAERRMSVARNMLNDCLPASEVVEALRVRFQVSKRTAQRDVQKARKMSG